MGTALAGIALVAPWLVWLGFVTAPLTTILLGAVAIIGAAHGWGRMLARLSQRDDVDAALAMMWGIACLLAVGGLLLAVGRFDARMLVLVGATLHSADLALRFTQVREAIASLCRWEWARFWLLPVGLLVAVSLVNLLGAAGQLTARMFDDESHLIAQVERLATTGGLSDPLGFPRLAQLGGHVTLGALATPFGDAQLARMVDRGLGLFLFLLLVCSRTGLRDASAAIWSLIVVLLAAGFRPSSADLLPLWTCAGLVVGLYGTLTTTQSRAPRAALPIGVVAGALCVVRTELAPFAFSLLLAAMWSERRQWSRDLRRTLTVLAAAVSIVLIYEIARRLAWSTVAADARLALSPRSWPWPVKAALCAAVASALVPLFSLAVRHVDADSSRSLGWFAVATSVTVGAIATRVVGLPASSSQLLWALVIAGFAVLAIALARQTAVPRAAMLLAVLGCVLVYEAQISSGRRGWTWRTSELMADIQQARDGAPQLRVYNSVFARIPAGERVAVWVGFPEHLDYGRHAIVDLRTPQTVRANKLDRVLRASRARWLVVDADGATRLGTVLENARQVLNTGGIRLVQLR